MTGVSSSVGPTWECLG